MTLRDQQLERFDTGAYDVLIVGAGINGAVSAAALAGHGLRVALVDRSDFAAETSQASSNLIWGGFKYLENYEFSLVRKLCRSRNRLMAAYPSSVVEKRFVAALGSSAPFSATYATAGAYAYWALGAGRTQRPRRLSTRQLANAEAIVDTTDCRGAVEYSDAFLPDNDSRFVFQFIRRAIDVGATAANYVELVGSEHSPTGWRSLLRDHRSGRELVLSSAAIVNAAGPFLDELNENWDAQSHNRLVFSKGVHLVVDQLTNSGSILAFFDDTGRLFYVIPMGNRSVIGTTDTRSERPDTSVTDADRRYLISQLNARLNLDQPLDPSNIIAERCGVRPLVVERDTITPDDDWTALSRKHVIETNRELDLISIFGGKLTDCLNVGDEVVDAVRSLGLNPSGPTRQWYGEPGPDLRAEYRRRAAGLTDRASADWPSKAARLWRRYGYRALQMVDEVDRDPALAEPVLEGSAVMGVEVRHMAQHEMVTTLDDFLRRRTDISLTLRESHIRAHDQILDVARVLFGDQAEERYIERFSPQPTPTPESESAPS